MSIKRLTLCTVLGIGLVLVFLWLQSAASGLSLVQVDARAFRELGGKRVGHTTEWEQVASPGDVKELVVLDDHVFARTDSILFSTRDCATRWYTPTINVSSLPSRLYALDADLGTLYVATNRGVLMSEDLGENFAWSFYWTWDGTRDVDFQDGYGWNVVQNWGSRSGPNRKTPEGYWELRRGNIPWSRMSLYWVAVDPLDPINVAYVGHDGGPYGSWRFRTLDGGETWTSFGDRLILNAVLDSKPTAISYERFTQDRGETWQPLGIRARAVIKDEDTGLVVAAHRDGGVYIGRPGQWQFYGLMDQRMDSLAICERRLLASSENGNIFRTNAPYRAVSLAPDHHTEAAPGSIVTYTHILANVGSYTDTFDLDISSGWGTLLTSSPVTLAHNATATVRARVTVPESAIRGMIESTVIMATSQADRDVHATVNDTTIVEADHVIYLPIIKRAYWNPEEGEIFYIGQRSSSQCAEHDSYIVPLAMAIDRSTISAGTVISAEYRIRATHPLTEMHPLDAPWQEWCDADWADCPKGQQTKYPSARCQAVAQSGTVDKLFDNTQEQIYGLRGPSDIGTFTVTVNGQYHERYTAVVFGSRWGSAQSWNHDGVIYANGFTRWKPKGEAPGAATDPCFGTSVILGPFQLDEPFLSDGYSPNPLRHPTIEAVTITVGVGWEARMTGVFAVQESNLMDVTWSVKRLNIDSSEMLVSVSQEAKSTRQVLLPEIWGQPGLGQVELSSMYAGLQKHDADTQIGPGHKIWVGDISSFGDGLWGQEKVFHALPKGDILCLETETPTTHNVGSPTLCIVWIRGQVR